ncbi:MAG: HesA/MoeB/ThiF family protein [Bacteroidetes bacterium]|nr:HesA/MoeB/ThiF family protein [Bacteroidota bacterium]
METPLRYANQLKVTGFTHHHQRIIQHARVLVVGAGGLGCPVLLQLSALGLGHITLYDHDHIETHNLNRQTLYSEQHLGQPKAITAAGILRGFNPDVEIVPVVEMLGTKQIASLDAKWQVVVDCTDNIATRHLLDHFCQTHGIPLVFGGVRMLEGQFGVFNYRGGPSFSKAFPAHGRFERIEDCNLLGTFAFACHMVASYQVNEVFKIITGLGRVMSGKVTTINLESVTHFTVGF